MNTMFMFPGQGSQVLKMGLDFYEKYQVAKDVFHEVDDSLNYKLSDIIFGDDSEKLLLTEHTQPALMTVSIAILRTIEFLKNQKVSEMCDFVAGHSLGEYSALCVSGVLSLSDTAKLLQIRGEAMSESCKQKEGGMIALLGIDVDKAQELCDITGLNIANDNSVGQIVISGEISAIDKAMLVAKDLGIKKSIKLAVNGAFHSPLMDLAKNKLEEKIDNFKFNEPNIKIISNVTADIVENISDIKKLLISQITSQVRWRETLLNVNKMGVNKMVEVGSGKVLFGLAKRTLENVELYSISNILDELN